MKAKFIITACATALMAGTVGAKDIEMQAIFPQTLPLLGKPAWDISAKVDTLTAGGIHFDVKNPGEIVATGEVWDAVSTGAVESSWYSIGFAEGVIPSAPLFTTFPFGPDVKEYAAWWFYGGGKELWAEITEAKYNIKTIHCGTLVPEASGWFREEITSLDQLRVATGRKRISTMPRRMRNRPLMQARQMARMAKARTPSTTRHSFASVFIAPAPASACRAANG